MSGCLFGCLSFALCFESLQGETLDLCLFVDLLLFYCHGIDETGVMEL